MTHYQASDLHVEVLGASILSVVDGVGDAAIPVLEKYEIFPLEADEWYVQQNWLDAFSELSRGNFLNLVAIGMKIPDNAAWPPHVQSVHDALSSINVAYQMNHRNGIIGGYHYEETGERSGVMTCDNPYPSDFDYGIIYRTVQKFRDAESQGILVKVDHTQPTRKNGGESCTYIVSW